MKFEDIQAEWAEDCTYDPHDVSEELAKLPRLQQKYLTYLIQYRAKVKQSEQNLATMRREKTDFYRGRTQHPYPVKIVGTETDVYIRGDEDFQRVESALEMAKIAVDFLTRVLKMIESRSYDLRASMEWNRFTSGGK